MLRVLLAVCLVSLALVAVAITAAPGASPADFTYAASSGLNTLDPAQMSWTKDLRVAINIWEGLTAYDPKTTAPIAGAARFPPRISPDGLVYEFTIRPDARWSNGDAVTAADFVRGWRRAVEPGTAGDYAALLVENIAGLRQYYNWRNYAVSVLTALDRLAGGWAIDAEAARALHHAVQLSELPALMDHFRTPERAPGELYDALAERLSASDTDWRDVHRQYLRRHARACDERFAGTGIRAIDDSTLRVTLTQPCPYFLDLCAFPTFVPIHRSIEHLRERYADLPLTEQGLVVYDQQWVKPDYHARGYPGLITNGPYRLADWQFKRRLRLVRNPYHREHDRIACPTIDRMVHSDPNTAVMAYETGDVDFLPGMDVHYDHRLIQLSVSGQRPDFHNPDVLATHFYIFNCRDAEVLGRVNPFTDARVRRAFCMAVDKKLLVEKVLARGEPVSDHLVPVGLIAGYESPPALTADPVEARRLLAEAGYPDGRGLPAIDLLYNTAGVDEKTCQVLARMWREVLGARVELRGKEPKTFAEDKVNRRYAIARAGWYGDYNDPTTFLDIFRSDNGNNDAGYANRVYDDLLEQAGRVRCADQALARGDGRARTPRLSPATERMALLARAETILVREDCPLLPLYQHTNLMAVKPYVKGLYPNARLVFPFRYVTVKRPP